MRTHRGRRATSAERRHSARPEPDKRRTPRCGANASASATLERKRSRGITAAMAPNASCLVSWAATRSNISTLSRLRSRGFAKPKGNLADSAFVFLGGRPWSAYLPAIIVSETLPFWFSVSIIHRLSPAILRINLHDIAGILACELAVAFDDQQIFIVRATGLWARPAKHLGRVHEMLRKRSLAY